MPTRFFLIIKKKEQEEIVNVKGDEENFNEKINLQNNKCDDSIDLDVVD